MSSVATTEGKLPDAFRGSWPPSPSSSSASDDNRAVEEEEEEACPGETPKRAAVAGGEKEKKPEAPRLALCWVPEAGEEMKEVEERIEEMLIKLDEFCNITDMIRTDTPQLLDEVIPLIKAKVIEINNIYTKVDKLEAYVKMVVYHVSFLEEQVIQAEKAHAIFPHTVQKLLDSVAILSLKKKCTFFPQHTYNLPELYRTEDYSSSKYIGSKYQNC